MAVAAPAIEMPSALPTADATTRRQRMRSPRLLQRVVRNPFRHRRLHECLEEEGHDEHRCNAANPGQKSKMRFRWLETRGSRRIQGATIMGSIANLANTNMGVGMLALPSAMSSAGVVGGCALLFVSAGIATFGSHLLVECITCLGHSADLPRITEGALGRVGRLCTDASVIVFSMSCAISYLIVVGDMLPEICLWLTDGAAEDASRSSSMVDSRTFWILSVLPIVVPLAFLRRIDSLRFASLLVVGCAGIIVTTVILFAWQPSSIFDPCAELRPTHTQQTRADTIDAACRGPVLMIQDAQHTLSALPTFLFAFAAQINIPSLIRELHRPTPRRIWAVLLGGTGLTVANYLIVGAGGYGTYGANVTGDLLLAYPRAAVVARVALVFVVILSHPLVSYPVSPSISNTLSIIGCVRERSCEGTAAQGRAMRSPQTAHTALAQPSMFVTDVRQAAIISCYLLVTTTVALIVSDLGLVISLAGAVTATTIVFIVPGACYWSLHSSQGMTRKRVLAGFFFLVGCMLQPLLALLVLASYGYFGHEWALSM